ncbi:hypothetical protein ACFXHA_04500 [Nocardia sp. NPDC059240]|uniref:hypothetical protein n=1 Tax=Nocardia sp. NPDC059240 TaxID=3346786 RepID=UPI003683E5E2
MCANGIAPTIETMTISAPVVRRVVGWVLGMIAAAAWIYYAGIFLLLISALAVADNRCDTEANAHPQMNPTGIPWVLGSGLLWVTPFAIVALIRRDRITVGLAALAAAVAIFFMTALLVVPQQGFCW